MRPDQAVGCICRGVANHRMVEQPGRPVSNDRVALGGNIPASLWYPRAKRHLDGHHVSEHLYHRTHLHDHVPGRLTGNSARVVQAAEIDGANKWQQFRKITVPMFPPIVLLIVVLGTIGTWQIFDTVKI